MQINDWLLETQNKFQTVGIQSARLDSLLILENVLKKDRTWLIANPQYVIEPKRANRLREKRLKRQPMAYILGQKQFYGLDFKVDQNVLIPRPETEVMVEYAIKNITHQKHILELGTGSGAIAIALAKQREDLSIVATDISDQALKIAIKNTKEHAVNIKFIKSDLFDNVSGKFDVILANLPYVPNAIRHEPELDYEPSLALYSGDDGLDLYRRFLAKVKDFLKPSGFILIEASPTQKQKLESLVKDLGMTFEVISEYIFKIKRKNF